MQLFVTCNWFNFTSAKAQSEEIWPTFGDVLCICDIKGGGCLQSFGVSSPVPSAKTGCVPDITNVRDRKMYIHVYICLFIYKLVHAQEYVFVFPYDTVYNDALAKLSKFTCTCMLLLTA